MDPVFFSDSSIKTDVFETLYTKRPSKSSKSSRSSSESFTGYRTGDLPSSPNRPNYFYKDSIESNGIPILSTPLVLPTPKISPVSSTISTQTPQNTQSTSGSKVYTTARSNNKNTTILRITAATPPPTERNSPIATPKSKRSAPTKPREYLFGTIERPTKPTKSVANEDDRFKTITLKDVRRSFRESYLKNDNRAEKQHQPLWFVDVKNEKKDCTPERDLNRDDSYTKTMYMEFDAPNKRPVSRKETFKIHRPVITDFYDDHRTESRAPNISLKRRETIKVDDPIQVSFVTDTYKRPNYTDGGRTVEAIRVELNSTAADRTGKIVPVGIAAPYNSQNDCEDNSVASRRRFFNKLCDEPRDHYRSSQSNLLHVPQIKEYIKRPVYNETTKVVPSNRITTSKPLFKKTNENNNNRNKFSYDFSWKKQNSDSQNSKANLGFDNFYDPNYCVPKNRNLILGANSAGYRAVNLKILPKPRESSVRSNPNNWVYNKVHL